MRTAAVLTNAKRDGSLISKTTVFETLLLINAAPLVQARVSNHPQGIRSGGGRKKTNWKVRIFSEALAIVKEDCSELPERLVNLAVTLNAAVVAQSFAKTLFDILDRLQSDQSNKYKVSQANLKTFVSTSKQVVADGLRNKDILLAFVREQDRYSSNSLQVSLADSAFVQILKEVIGSYDAAASITRSSERTITVRRDNVKTLNDAISPMAARAKRFAESLYPGNQLTGEKRTELLTPLLKDACKSIETEIKNLIISLGQRKRKTLSARSLPYKWAEGLKDLMTNHLIKYKEMEVQVHLSLAAALAFLDSYFSSMNIPETVSVLGQVPYDAFVWLRDLVAANCVGAVKMVAKNQEEQFLLNALGGEIPEWLRLQLCSSSAPAPHYKYIQLLKDLTAAGFEENVAIEVAWSISKKGNISDSHFLKTEIGNEEAIKKQLTDPAVREKVLQLISNHAAGDQSDVTVDSIISSAPATAGSSNSQSMASVQMDGYQAQVDPNAPASDNIYARLPFEISDMARRRATASPREIAEFYDPIMNSELYRRIINIHPSRWERPVAPLGGVPQIDIKNKNVGSQIIFVE